MNPLFALGEIAKESLFKDSEAFRDGRRKETTMVFSLFYIGAEVFDSPYVQLYLTAKTEIIDQIQDPWEWSSFYSRLSDIYLLQVNRVKLMK